MILSYVAIIESRIYAKAKHVMNCKPYHNKPVHAHQEEVYSSVVEHSFANPEVPSSIPGSV